MYFINIVFRVQFPSHNRARKLLKILLLNFTLSVTQHPGYRSVYSVNKFNLLPNIPSTHTAARSYFDSIVQNLSFSNKRPKQTSITFNEKECLHTVLVTTSRYIISTERNVFLIIKLVKFPPNNRKRFNFDSLNETLVFYPRALAAYLFLYT